MIIMSINKTKIGISFEIFFISDFLSVFIYCTINKIQLFFCWESGKSDEVTSWKNIEKSKTRKADESMFYRR